MNDELSAELILERILAREKDALAALYDMYERLVYSFAYRCTGDASAAEEVVQDVFTKIWRTTARYQPTQGKVSTWLLSITRHAAIDYHRRTKRHQHTDSGDEALVQVLDPSPGPDDLAEAASTRQHIKRAISSLPSEQRQVIEHIYFLGQAQQEVADELGLSTGTVKSRVRLAMTKLRTQLQSETGVNSSV